MCAHRMKIGKVHWIKRFWIFRSIVIHSRFICPVWIIIFFLPSYLRIFHYNFFCRHIFPLYEQVQVTMEWNFHWKYSHFIHALGNFIERKEIDHRLCSMAERWWWWWSSFIIHNYVCLCNSFYFSSSFLRWKIYKAKEQQGKKLTRTGIANFDRVAKIFNEKKTASKPGVCSLKMLIHHWICFVFSQVFFFSFDDGNY